MQVGLSDHFSCQDHIVFGNHVKILILYGIMRSCHLARGVELGVIWFRSRTPRSIIEANFALKRLRKG
jgi:hypothetical protein